MVSFEGIISCSVVEGDELDMRLMHLTEQPLNDYFGMVQSGNINKPVKYGVGKSFIMSEEEQKEELRRIFEQHSSAKIKV